MDILLVEGKFVKPEDFTDSKDLPTPYYGRIRWEKIQAVCKKSWKLFNRLPAPLKVMVKLMDQMECLKVCHRYRTAIVAAAKLEAEREALAFKAQKPDRISPSDGFIFTHNAVNFVIAQYLNIEFYTGIGIDHVCSSGLDIIGIAADMMARGKVDVAIVAAVNSMACPSRTAYHRNLQVVSKSGVIRPFDANRDGTIFADGLAVAMICSKEVAEREGLSAKARITGYSQVSDSSHMFSLREDGAGFEKVIEAACKGKVPSVIKAHATGTKANDRIEAKVYTKLFGKKPVVTALKPIFGHGVTSSGLTETLYLIENLKEGKIPKIATLEELDPECAGINVAKEEVPFTGGTVLSVSAGFGGFFSALTLEVL